MSLISYVQPVQQSFIHSLVSVSSFVYVRSHCRPLDVRQPTMAAFGCLDTYWREGERRHLDSLLNTTTNNALLVCRDAFPCDHHPGWYHITNGQPQNGPLSGLTNAIFYSLLVRLESMALFRRFVVLVSALCCTAGGGTVAGPSARWSVILLPAVFTYGRITEAD